MTESDGRRIKRSLFLDRNTIRFCDETMLKELSRIQYIQKPIDRNKKKLSELNLPFNVDDASLVNGRRMTNAGIFRAYMTVYLKRHPMINQEMTLPVRQQEPTSKSLPIPIDIFFKAKPWILYEDIQSDIFDHLLAALPEFGLRVFQSPSGVDMREAGRHEA